LESCVSQYNVAARKKIQGGDDTINKLKHNDSTHELREDDLVNDKYLIVQRGKKNYFLLIAE